MSAKSHRQIAYRARGFRRWYVSELPGQGGIDWGYSVSAKNAKPLSQYWARRFAADMRRINDVARFIPASKIGPQL